MDDEGTIEWTTLKSLRSHRHRFAKVRFQNLHALWEAELQALDLGLRQLFNRPDLDHLVRCRCPDVATAETIQCHLESLCSLLDDRVRTELLSSSPTEPEQHKYPRLSALVATLAATDWPFELLSDQGRSIFQPTPVSNATPEQARGPGCASAVRRARDIIDAFNNFLDGLGQPIAEEASAEREAAWQGFQDRALPALGALFSSLETAQGCHHKVLVELPEWRTFESEELSSGRGGNLFLFNCVERFKEKPKLQEGRIDGGPYRDAAPPHHAIGSICDGIGISRSGNESLRLLVEDNKVVVANDQSYSKSYPEYYPAKTLEELLVGHYLVDTQDWNPAIPEKRFLTHEKRSLALKLVLSCATYLGCEFAIEPWDPKRVYFPIGPGGHCVQHAAYALCLPKNQSKLPSTEESSSPFVDLTPLAKLLLEIECGFKLDDEISIGTNYAERALLDKKIGTWLPKSKDPGQRAYLEAVKECLNFEQTCRSVMGQAGAAPGADYIATARSVLYTRIAKKIRSAVPQPRPKRSRPVVGPSNEGCSSCRRQLVFVSACRQDQRPHKKSKRTGTEETTGYSSPPLGTVDHDLNSQSFEASSSLPQGSRAVIPHHDVRSVEEESWVNVDKDFLALFGGYKEHTRCEACPITSEWMWSFKTLVAKLGSHEARESPLKIAVLDTGIDMRHPIIEDERSRIKDAKTWHGGCAYEDHNGHGTFVAGVLLDLTSNVDIFIGKVMNSETCESRDHIAQAIRHARDEWKVDMISLSFSYRAFNGEDAVAYEIRECVKEEILVFAAASNDSRRRHRAYPANYDQVFCIHASDGVGGKWGFNPTPVQDAKEDNFSVVGQCVAWPPVAYPEAGVTQEYRSGTSFATPVAVSIAIFMIKFIKHNMASYRWNIDPCTPAGMTRIFRELKADIDGYEWVCPERYLATNSLEMVCLRLKELLGGYEV